MRLIRHSLPLTFALCLASVSAAATFSQDVSGSREGQARRQRVVATGRLTGTSELQHVAIWQTAGAAHLAVETAALRPRVLWQTAGSNSESVVDSVRIADLDGDGVPEILSLWWKGSSRGATLRGFHWDRARSSFVELQIEDEINNVRGYQVVSPRGSRSSSRLLIDTRTGNGTRRPTGTGVEYQLRGSKLVRAGGGRIVTSQGESGIEGQAIISPSHPGPIRQGTSSTAPYKTTLVVWSAEGDREITRLETGSDGRFRVVLPPGTYRIGPPQRAGRFLPRGSEETVTVVPGKFVQVTISFDSGMR